MLRTDPKLWVTVGPNYTGFVYKPTKGWLDATAKTTDKHSGRDQRASGITPSTTTTATDVCAQTELRCTETVEKTKR